MEEFITSHWLALLSIAVQGGICKFFWGLYKQYQVKADARDAALRALLRVQIISRCHKSQREGFIAVYNLENLNDMFAQYTVLGGNGAVVPLVKRTQQLPCVEKEM